MIELTMLPGKDGDCLLLSYGDGTFERRVLVDGGRASSYDQVKPVLASLEPAHLDLLVVTHVDQDHVLGVLKLLEDEDHVGVGEVWFNGYDHLKDVALETFGAKDGELLTTKLLEQHIPWNAAFEGRAIEHGSTPAGFDDGARFHVVAPDRVLLEQLVAVWEEECRKHGLIPGVEAQAPPAIEGFEQLGALDIEKLAATPFDPDESKPNASSIAFLFEYDGVRILFTGDGDDRRMVESLKPLAEAEGGRVHLDALKVSHHGSAGNLSRELLELIDCPRYLISTNGARHGHPDAVAMARILKYGGDSKELVFNYRERATDWDLPEWKEKYGYTVTVPPGDQDGRVTLAW